MAPAFPTEIMQSIIWHLIDVQKGETVTSMDGDMRHYSWGFVDEAPLYATVNNVWQHIIERETFECLYLNLDRLAQMGDIVNVRRRSYVRMIWLHIVLPPYVGAAWGQVETEEDQRQNNIVFTATIKAFLEQMSLWKPQETHQAGLEMWFEAFSRNDDCHCDVEESEQRRAYPRKTPQIWRQRYINSILELKDLDVLQLPEVHVITELRMDSIQRGRYYAGAALITLLARLRNAKVALILTSRDDETDRLEKRRRLRHECAIALGNVVDVPGRLELAFPGPGLQDHFANPPILTPSDGGEDLFSRNLRAVSQKAVDIHIEEVMIGNEFFWPLNPPARLDMPHWPFLRILQLGYRLSTPSGEWRFEHTAPSTPRPVVDSDDEDYDPDDEMYEPTDHLRKRAIPAAMNSFYLAVARAALEMPKLEKMSISACVKPHNEVWHWFLYRVRDSGVTATWSSNPSFQPDGHVVDLWKSVATKYHGSSLEVTVCSERVEWL